MRERRLMNAIFQIDTTCVCSFSRKHLLVFLLFVFVSACSKQVAIDAPREIRELIKENCPPCGQVINEYKWNNQTYYTFSCNGPGCNCVTVLYDASGNRIGYVVPGSSFDQDAELLRNLWTCR